MAKKTLLKDTQNLILPFIRAADKKEAALEALNDATKGASRYRDTRHSDEPFKGSLKAPPHDQINGASDGSLIDTSSLNMAGTEHHHPQELTPLMKLRLPQAGLAHDGFLKEVEKILEYSVNTWDPGFMSKLYASTDAPGLAAELLLASLNTNVHTYEVSPALTIIEKHTTRALAALFGFTGPHAGGISVQGGSASNTTSIVIARNTLYPATKTQGNHANGLKLLLFTSAHGHYSISKAAQMLGLGSSSVWSVPVDPKRGTMDASALPPLIAKAKTEGYTPFYLNATAGTTVLGSFDPFPALSAICKAHNIWMHIDASWGGPLIFSPTHKQKLEGSQYADSIAINPHKMMGVPITCSFLLSPDLRQFHASNTLPATYLFHASDDPSAEVHDLADLTLQCGRKGDSLKLYLSWVYHGTEGYRAQIDAALGTAAYLADLVAQHPDLVLHQQLKVPNNPPTTSLPPPPNPLLQTMCLTISYVYPCGHTEDETFDLDAVVCEADGSVWEPMREQMVVMKGLCVGCRKENEDEPCELALDEWERERGGVAMGW
ncbi:MAG: hypothetical protein Q9195_003268 [Heterodermia aff. obscurata]